MYNKRIFYIPFLEMKVFSSRNMSGFTFQDLAMEFPEKNPVHLARIPAGMVDEGKSSL